MKNNETNRMKRNPLALYFTLALLISWLIESPLIAMRQGWVEWNIPYSIHYLASFGPMLSALIVTAATSGSAGLRELWGRIIRWRVNWKYAAFALLSPVVIFTSGMPIIKLITGEWPNLNLLGQANYLPFLGFWVLPIWLITFGFGEEIGWRGFALPRLQKTMSISKATLILGLFWILWHVPTFFYHETYIGMGWMMLPGFVIGVLCGTVLFTWLYNGTGGSILMVAIWHGLFDLLTASKAGQDIIPIIMSAGVIIWALVVSNVNRTWGFRFQKKQTI